MINFWLKSELFYVMQCWFKFIDRCEHDEQDFKLHVKGQMGSGRAKGEAETR